MDILQWNAMNVRWITEYIREKTGLDSTQVSPEESNRLAMEWIKEDAARVRLEFNREGRG